MLPPPDSGTPPYPLLPGPPCAISSPSSDDARIATFPSAFRPRLSRTSQATPSHSSSLTSIFPGASSYPVVSPRAATHHGERGEHHNAAKKSPTSKTAKHERGNQVLVHNDSSDDEEHAEKHQTIHIHEVRCDKTLHSPITVVFSERFS